LKIRRGHRVIRYLGGGGKTKGGGRRAPYQTEVVRTNGGKRGDGTNKIVEGSPQLYHAVPGDKGFPRNDGTSGSGRSVGRTLKIVTRPEPLAANYHIPEGVGGMRGKPSATAGGGRKAQPREKAANREQ